MFMTSQHEKKVNKKNKNIKKSAYIQYQLKLKGLNIQKVADELGISISAVSKSFYDISKISRVDEWLRENLGIDI